jgi:hypothetical protein
MLFALMTLVALSLAAVALVRSVNTGTLVVGNLGFKQDTTAYAEQASEAAIAYLSDQISGTTLNANVTAEGYYATSYQELDATNRTPAVTTRAVVDWAGDACAAYTAGSFAGGCLTPKVSVAANGNTTRYLITRLCSAALSATDPANVCAGPLTTSAAASTEKGGIDYANPTRFGVPGAGPYFRIVVRATGARNTTTYTETIVHF